MLREQTPDANLHVIVPYGPHGSSARVRALDWLNHCQLDAITHDYLGLPVNSPKLVLSQPARAWAAERSLWRLTHEVRTSTVLLVREASPFSRGFVESALLRNAERAVYDFDDALMEPQPSMIERVFSKAVKWRRCVAAADVVIAGNDVLADAAQTAGAADVRLIPSCVEPLDYRLKANFERKGPPVSVWLGSPATEHYLSAIADSLLRVHSTVGLRLAVISAGGRSFGALDRMVDRHPWTPTAHQELASFDFGLMPLPDDPWTRGKCAYKLLQYGATGLPMIGSPVGANRAALDVMGGLAASSFDDWVDALTTLSTMNPIAMAELGWLGRAGVEAHYSFTSWASVWRGALGLDRG